MRYFLSVLAVIVFLVVVIVLIVTNHSGPGTTAKIINITSYNTPNSAVSFITDGTLVGNDQRQAIEITITQSSRSIYILDGYNQNIASQESFTNVPAAYSAFLGAMANYGFTDSRSTSEQNMFAICPLGNTFQYQLTNFSSLVSNLWGTTCSNSDGNFNGYGSTVNYLFTLQIPNYAAFTQGVTTVSPISGS